LPWLILFAGFCMIGGSMVASGLIGAYYYVAPSLPPVETIREIPLQIPLRIYSRDGRLIEEVGERRRILISYEELPQFVVEAFIAAEDGRFFEHSGVDPFGILRALLLMLKSGEITGGGSTITQQLARDYFLTRDQLFTRKLLEAFLAYKIEQEFSKEEIMALFLNKMFFGQRAYGVAAAAQVYFGKNLGSINVAEAATLAGVLPAPTNYNPVRSVANATMRRNYVVGRMYELGYIDAAARDDALNFPMESNLHGTANELSAPYVAEMVRREMLTRYGESTYAAGFKVITTLDSKMQRSANYAVRNGLLEFSRRRGYRGPIATVELEPGVLEGPYAEWPDEVKGALQDYGNPGGLSVAIVTALNADNSADIVLQDGSRTRLEWFGVSWARRFVDSFTRGEAPQRIDEVMTPGHIVYVMPVQGGGWALAQIPEAQSALVSVDPNDGAITSLVGGFDFTLSKFNRASQSARQPGSSFKPFIYSAALEAGNTLATVILDAPVVIDSSALERVWKPVNYSGRFYGEQRVREAMVRSMNLASVRLLLNNTGISNAIRHLEPFGFPDATLIRNGSLALGGGSASPLDMAQAYATFANGGYSVKPYIIDAIIGPTEEILYRADPAVACPKCEIREATPEVVVPPPEPLYPVSSPDDPFAFADEESMDAESKLSMSVEDRQFIEELERGYSLEQMAELAETYQPDATQAPELFAGVNRAKRIITAQNAFLIQDAMRDVIQRGTAVRARVLGRSDLSGKTGTSNDRRDAWFAGFNSGNVGIVWVGYDDDQSLGPREEGSRTALPIWIEFMRVALKGLAPQRMAMPEGIVTVRISKTTGCPASASHPFEDVMFEHFMEDSVPKCSTDEEQIDIFNAAEEPVNKDGTLF
jgi:penicillin-binding protein 1A